MNRASDRETGREVNLVDPRPNQEMGNDMPYALFCRETREKIPFGSENEVWVYVRSKGLCSEDLGNEELPARRVLHPGYEIHVYSTEQTLIEIKTVNEGV